MNIEDLNKKKAPIIKIDNSLKSFSKKILFPEKVEKANQMLREIGLPKIEQGK